MSETLTEEVWTAQEVGDWLGISKITVCEKARKGEIPARKVGRTLQFSRAAIESMDLEPFHRDPNSGKPPHPWKRWCHANHDTYKCGRYKISKACVECTKEKNKAKSGRDRAARAQRNRSEYMPHLKAYREKRGYTRSQIAWESAMPQMPSMTVEILEEIEEQKLKASYRQRVAIFQAFNVLGAREREAREAEIEESQRRVRAGVA